MKANFITARPFKEDEMNLPVEDLKAALPFYETTMGFRVISVADNSAVLGRDDVQIGLAENGGDPTQDGCFFEVDNVEAAFSELKSNGLAAEANFAVQNYGTDTFKIFFVVAPDGLCYCLGESLK